MPNSISGDDSDSGPREHSDQPGVVPERAAAAGIEVPAAEIIVDDRTRAANPGRVADGAVADSPVQPGAAQAGAVQASAQNQSDGRNRPRRGAGRRGSGKNGGAGKGAGAGTAGAKRHKASRFELPILIVVAIAIAIVLKTFVVQPFYIPSQSMEQTLHGCPGCAGDRILVFKPVYKVRDPHPGDIVVFKAPANWDEAGGVTLSPNPVVHAVQWFGQLVGIVPPSEKDLVKRVIATGGQTVRCCDSNGNLQVSDNSPTGPWRSLNEPYIFENSPWTPPNAAGVKSPDDTRSFGPVTVPKGRLWVMGDHRGDSADSRYHCGGGGTGSGCDPNSSTVPVSDVIGKAVVIAWPPSRWRTLGTPKTFQALGIPGLAAVPAEPATIGLASVFCLGVWRRRRRR